jgi:hypothetical protein
MPEEIEFSNPKSLKIINSYKKRGDRIFGRQLFRRGALQFG